MAHVSQRKKDDVKKTIELLEKYPNVGIVNMYKLPAAQLLILKKKLEGTAEIFMTKKRLMKIIYEQLKDKKKNIQKLEEYLKNAVPALILTKENPFSLFKTIKKNKSPAPAKPGDISPKDIIIPAGPTPFTPGPIISELGSMGIIAGVENGKVAIKKDATVAKKGEPIKPAVAGLLPKFNILPMEIGLDIIAIYEKGKILTKDVLDIDEEEYINNITKLARESLSLALETTILTKETTEYLITKTARETLALARETNIFTKETIQEMIAKANSQSLLIKSKTQ